MKPPRTRARAGGIALRALAVVVLLVLLSVPALASGPSTCLSDCAVTSSVAGYVPAVMIVESGAEVAWSGLPVENLGHTATEVGAASPCVNVLYSTNPGRATFTIHDGALWAAQPLKAEKRCATATALPDGSFALRLFCQYHPNTMQGVLVVRP